MIESSADSLASQVEKKERQQQARDAWMRTSDSYKAVFTIGGDGAALAAAGNDVMRDLEAFCCANRRTAVVAKATGAVDPLQSMILEGRREVFLRIQHMLGLTARDVHRLSQSD